MYKVHKSLNSSFWECVIILVAFTGLALWSPDLTTFLQQQHRWNGLGYFYLRLVIIVIVIQMWTCLFFSQKISILEVFSRLLTVPTIGQRPCSRIILIKLFKSVLFLLHQKHTLILSRSFQLLFPFNLVFTVWTKNGLVGHKLRQRNKGIQR